MAINNCITRCCNYADLYIQYDVETIEFAKLRDLKRIGEGGFGEVYWARHSDWGPVAFKKLLVTIIRENDRYAFEIYQLS